MEDKRGGEEERQHEKSQVSGAVRVFLATPAVEKVWRETRWAPSVQSACQRSRQSSARPQRPEVFYRDPPGDSGVEPRLDIGTKAGNLRQCTGGQQGAGV